MATTITTTEALRVDIDEKRRMVLVPSAVVSVSGANIEVEGLLHVVVTIAGESTVHYYIISVESWTVETDVDEVRRKVERVLAKAQEKAKEYVRVIQTIKEFGIEINFRDCVSSRNWLPEWLRKYIE
jgi:hypothetical protein